MSMTLPPAAARATHENMSFWQGVRDCTPLLLSAIPFGFAFGILAMNAGLGLLGGQGFSLFIFAGSAQFAAAQAIQSHANLLVIILLILGLNLRHLLYALDLSTRAAHWNTKQRLLVGYFLTDEAYAVIARKLERIKTQPNATHLSARYALGAGVALFVPWNLATLAGLLFAQLMSAQAQATQLLQDFNVFILCAYIAIFVPLINSKPRLFAAIFAALFAALFSHLPHQFGLLLAIFLALILGLWLESLPAKKAAEQRASKD